MSAFLQGTIGSSWPKSSEAATSRHAIPETMPNQGFRKIWFEPKFQLTPVVFNF